MTARLNIRWTEDTWAQPARLLNLVRNVTQPKPQLRCPQCHSVVYTRRHQRCGVCEERLPGAVLFTPAEAWRIEQLVRLEQQKHRVWMERRAAAVG